MLKIVRNFLIAGLSEGYITQGISYDKDTDNFFMTGYMNDHSASPIYVANESASKKYIFGNFTGGKWCYASKF